MHTNDNAGQKESRDWKLLAYAVSAALLALVGGNSAFVIGMIGVPSAVVCAGRRMLDKQRRTLKMRLIAYGGCLLLFAAGPTGCHITTYRVDKAAEPIISAVEQHRLKHGIYPTIPEVAPILGKTPCPTIDGRFTYGPVNDGRDYYLIAVTYGFNKHIYQGSRKRWLDWD